MNAVSTPSSRLPPVTRHAPMPNTSASDRLPTARTDAVYVAMASYAVTFASR